MDVSCDKGKHGFLREQNSVYLVFLNSFKLMETALNASLGFCSVWNCLKIVAS